jgi:hypothetical protein
VQQLAAVALLLVGDALGHDAFDGEAGLAGSPPVAKGL